MRRVAAMLWLLLLSSQPAAARTEKWWDAYARGVAAVRSANYDVAAQALQAAIAEMPKEDAAARTKGEIIVYVPHFWLGIARFNLGDVDGALRELRTSEEQGVVQNTRYYADLREWLARAQAQKQKSADAIAADARKVTTAATRLAVSAQMDAVAAGGDRSDTYRAAQRKLAESRTVAASAGSDLRAYKRAADLAAEAQGLFKAAAEEARTQKASRPAPAPVRPQPAQVTVVQPSAPPPKPVEPAPVPAQVAPASITPPAVPQKEAEPAALDAAVADARVVVQQYRRRLSDVSSTHRGDNSLRDWTRNASREAEQWQRTVNGSVNADAARGIAAKVADRERELGLRLTDAERATAAAPVKPDSVQPELERAWHAYAAGDLARSEEVLTRVINSTRSAEALLLRGCSRYTQALLGRNPDALIASADEDFRSALAITRSLRLDSRVFSPKLVRHFDELRARR